MRYLSIFLLALNVWAQFPGRFVVRGELQIEGNDAGQDYDVELADCAPASPGARGRMSNDHQFEFDSVPPGCKVLRVVSGPQRAIVQEVQILAEETALPVVIRVANPQKEPVRSGVVSVERLRHPMPKEAARAIGDANRLSDAGKLAEAEQKLRPAAVKYPDMWELRLSLAIVEMKLHHVAAAAEDFLKAHELEPRSPAAAVDSGIALFALHRLDEAESAAKDAVALEPGNREAQLLLARIQAEKRQSTNSAATNR